MKWITREKARVDRIACPWLISRFIDRDAEFLFVPSDQVMTVAKRDQACGVTDRGRRSRGLEVPAMTSVATRV